jgi:hypothetical protein
MEIQGKKEGSSFWKSFVLRITIIKHMTRDLRIIAKGLSVERWEN